MVCLRSQPPAKRSRAGLHTARHPDDPLPKQCGLDPRAGLASSYSAPRSRGIGGIVREAPAEPERPAPGRSSTARTLVTSTPSLGPARSWVAIRSKDFTAGQARKLEVTLESHDVPHYVKLHPGVRHSFFNPRQRAHHPSAAEDSWRRTLVFYEQHLGGKS